MTNLGDDVLKVMAERIIRDRLNPNYWSAPAKEPLGLEQDETWRLRELLATADVKISWPEDTIASVAELHRLIA